MVELRGVSKQHTKGRGLLPTDLRIEPRKTTVLIGPSGSGKSTLLRLMMGLLWPDTGTVELEGVVLGRDNIRQIRRRIGYVIQEGGLFPHLSARRNIVLMASYLGEDRARIESRVDELSGLTQFPRTFLERFPTQLSGGERQRVSLMRALMLDPTLLLLDEPLGALDPIIRAELQTDLRRIFQLLGKTVVLVTHDVQEAAFFGDTLVLLRDGAVVQQGTLEQLWNDPADPFVTRFLGAQRYPSIQWERNRP